MLTMLVTLYTSRVILQALGIDDFGIYQTVGGIVGLLSFVNGALATGSSRFITYELGSGDNEKLRKTFSSTLSVHIILALVIFVLAETLGLWFLNEKLNVPQSRLYAANWVYQISIITAILDITQVPYTAEIISHEKMDVYAYVGIYEVITKLIVCYLLYLGSFDKLIFYAFLLFMVQVSLILFYRFYCIKHFEESSFHFGIDRNIFIPIAKFSGWSLFAGLSITINNQGINIITNIFFGPAIVAARAISVQVNGAVCQFIDNIRTATNPQIVKLYAAGEYASSKKLLLNSTKFSFYLMFLLTLPIILLAQPILHLWLGVVPPYTKIFLQLILIQSLFSVFDTSFYTALYAKGQLKENALISPFLGFLVFPIVYILFKIGYSPIALSWATLILYFLLGMVIKPILIIKIANYSWKEIFEVYLKCFVVVVISTPIPVYVSCVLNEGTYLNYLVILVVSICMVAFCSYFFGFDKNTKSIIKGIVYNKVFK